MLSSNALEQPYSTLGEKYRSSDIEDSAIGQIFTAHKSVNELFDLAFDSTSQSSSSSSSARASTTSSSKRKSKLRPKSRPCLIWSTIPNVQILLISKFDDVDITNPNVQISKKLSTEYILKRLLPIHPRVLNGKRAIATRSTKSTPASITDTYLILIPVTLANDELLKVTLEYFDANDMIHINEVMRMITLEENDERADIIRKINPPLLIDNEDAAAAAAAPAASSSSSSSISTIPTIRGYFIQSNLQSNDERIFAWLNQIDSISIKSNSSSFSSSASQASISSIDLIRYDDEDSNNHHLQSDLVHYGSPTLPPSSSSRAQQSTTMNFSSAGAPRSPLSGYNNNNNNAEPSPRLNIHSPIVTRQAPPLLCQFESNPPVRHNIARPAGSPPPPPMPTNIPSAPPLPNSTIQSLVMRPSTASNTTPARKTISDSNHGSSSQRDYVSVTSETSIQDQRPYIMRDLHSDLLDEIKKGIQLNNRKKEEEKKAAAAAAVTTKPSSLNVMAITEQAAKYRRDKIRPQSESENEDESSRWDDSD